MAERTVLLDATAEVRGAHLTLIANGTVAVVSAADFRKNYPENIVGRLIDDHHRFCTEVCAGHEYARTIPPKNSPAYPLSDSQALRDTMNRIGEVTAAEHRASSPAYLD